VVTSATGVDANTLFISFNPGFWGATQARIRSMGTYRAYHVDEHGHFRGVPQIFSAETDEDAIAHTKQLVDGHDVELWEEGSRCW
jgi:hypothetical protein